MKYEFHVGDYVETKTGTVGYVSNTTYVEGEYPCWMPTKLSSVDIRDDLYSLNNSYFIIDEDVERRFDRIGQYDFTKKDEGKIEPFQVNTALTEYASIFALSDKINELVDAVNSIRKEINND